LRGDKDVALAAVKQNGLVLYYASDELRGDKEVVLAAMGQNRLALKFASDELKKEFMNNGEIWVWGHNAYGQLGVGKTQ